MRLENLAEILKKYNQPAFRLKQLQKAIFQDGIISFAEISTISKELREHLEKEIKTLSLDTVKVLEAKDGQSFKALLKTGDGNLIETVLISPKSNIWSACISCQVGCQMGCRFCATGSMGFKRDLTAEEITDQILFWKHYLKNKKEKLSTIVYMGMGEPFNNWKNVAESIDILTDENLFGFGSRSISVSTSGVVLGIEKLAERFSQINLAISLHFTDDEKRSHYMPVNKQNNLESLREALKSYFFKTKRKVFIEYILLDSINDSARDAENLATYLKSIGNAHLLHVNLIRYNTTSVGFSPSSKMRTQNFRDMLAKKHINTTIRKSLGEEIKAACGQLAGR